MLHLIPAPVHRMLLPIAFRVRHVWRKFAKPQLTGCAVIVSDHEGSILLMRHSYGPRVWALPGGGVARGEDPAAAAQREIFEEVGIELSRLSLVTVLEDTISGAPNTTHLFAATTDQYPRADRREVLEAKFFPRHSLPEPQGTQTRVRLDVWRETLQR
ncbi:NUDIX hydrolase [Parerythrobacter aestuarii]|uniref:NUDIX hydrolase n=1 Tax=Parerythrobacter aestuarii TaxID=3020909 RepID=UPI0024DE2698|nr:NUDIX domain-containing protein [Parerythrobacter aestuarii]